MDGCGGRSTESRPLGWAGARADDSAATPPAPTHPRGLLYWGWLMTLSEPLNVQSAVALARLVYDMAHPDPGPLCPRCLRPYREWRDVPPCECPETGE